MKYLVLFSLIILASCTKQLEEKSATIIEETENANQLNFIGQWLNEGKRELLVRDFARNYEFENQHVRVNLKFAEEVYFDRDDVNSETRFLADQLTKGVSDWDVIRINDEYELIATYMNDPEWAAKYLVDFSQFPEYINNTMPALISSEVKNRWKGIIPGPFLEGQFYALWVNNKVTKKIGIEVKQFGMTFSDFLGYVKAADAYNKSNPNNAITIMHEASNWTTAFNVALQLYATLLNNDEIFYNDGVTEYKLQAWYQTLKGLEQLAQYNILSPECKTILWDDTKMHLIEEKCLFYSNGPWMYNIWLEQSKEATYNCMPTEYPVYNTATTYPASYQIMWAVPKNSPNKEEAIKFLLELNTPNTAELWVRYTKCPTGIQGNLTNASFGADPFENFSSHIQSNYGTNIYRVRDNTALLFGNSFENIPNYYKEVMLGEISADEAFNRLVVEIDLMQ